MSPEPPRVSLGRDPPGIAERQPFARHEDQPKQRHRHERYRVQHDRGPDRAIGGRREELHHRELVGGMERADSAGRRRGDADHENRHHEERTRVRKRNVKCPRRKPDSGRNRHPHGKRQRQRRHQSDGLSQHTESQRKGFDEPRDHAGQARRQHAFDPPCGAAETFGVPGEREQHDQAGHRGCRRHSAADFDHRELRRIPGDHARPDGKDEARKEQQHRHEVEDALENDGGKRRCRIQVLAPREQVRAQHFSDSSRDQRVRRKPDHGRFERDPVACGADGRQEQLPSPGANRVGQPGHDNGVNSSNGSARRVSAQTPAGSALRKKNASRPNVSRRINPVRTGGRMQLRQSSTDGALQALGRGKD